MSTDKDDPKKGPKKDEGGEELDSTESAEFAEDDATEVGDDEGGDEGGDEAPPLPPPPVTGEPPPPDEDEAPEGEGDEEGGEGEDPEDPEDDGQPDDLEGEGVLTKEEREEILAAFYAEQEALAENPEEEYEVEPDELDITSDAVSEGLGYVPGFAFTPFYRPDPELASTTGQIGYLFHVLLDLCGYGDFHALENLSYRVPPKQYWEGGRNYAPHNLPFENVGQCGELTLRWGMINRPWLYEWMNDVAAGGRFRRSVLIFHMNRRRMPVRVIRLRKAWPIEWKGPDLNTLDSNYPVEQLTIAYEGIRVFVNSVDIQGTVDAVKSL